MTTIGIIITTYNSETTIKECLNSIKKINRRIKKEVIIVDNASTDNTLTIINHKKGVNIIKNEKNVGYSKANNHGAKKAKAEYLLFLNPDTRANKSTVQTMLEFMERNKDVGAATCKVMLQNGRLDKACRRSFPTPWNIFCHLTHLDRVFPHSKILSRYNLTYIPEEKTIEVDSIVGAFFLVRREAFEEVGGWDEDYFLFGEDIDLCYKLKERGWKIVYYPKTTIIHQKGSSTFMHTKKKLNKDEKERRAEAIKHFHEAMQIFYHKHYGKKYSSITKAMVTIGIKSSLAVALCLNKLR